MDMQGIYDLFDRLRNKTWRVSDLVLLNMKLADMDIDTLAAMYCSTQLVQDTARKLCLELESRMLERELPDGDSHDSMAGWIVYVESDGDDSLRLPVPPCACKGEGCEICDVDFEYASWGRVIAEVGDPRHPLGESAIDADGWYFPLLCRFKGIEGLVAIPRTLVYDHYLPDGRHVYWEQVEVPQDPPPEPPPPPDPVFEWKRFHDDKPSPGVLDEV